MAVAEGRESSFCPTAVLGSVPYLGVPVRELPLGYRTAEGAAVSGVSHRRPFPVHPKDIIQGVTCGEDKSNTGWSLVTENGETVHLH